MPYEPSVFRCKLCGDHFMCFSSSGCGLSYQVMSKCECYCNKCSKGFSTQICEMVKLDVSRYKGNMDLFYDKMRTIIRL